MFLWELQEASMRWVVEQVFGPWDRNWQRQRFDQGFDPAHVRIIRHADQDIGAIYPEHRVDEIHIGRFQIDPRFQNQGLGSMVLRDVLDQAAEEGKTVALDVFTINPARRLYERLGFVEQSASDGRILMRADPGA